MTNRKKKEKVKTTISEKKFFVFRFFLTKYENRQRIKKSIKTGMSLGNIKEPKMKEKNVCFQITG